MDELTLECETVEHGIDREAMADQVSDLLREHMGLRLAVKVLAPGALERTDGKAIRLVDRRPRD